MKLEKVIVIDLVQHNFNYFETFKGVLETQANPKVCKSIFDLPSQYESMFELMTNALDHLELLIIFRKFDFI